jgi:outer membrane protein OmpA-like peptidoglycan-associated protein
MKTIQFLIPVTAVALLASCATVVPMELKDASMAYQEASAGKAAEVVPAELHTAHEALLKAEKSFKEDKDSYKTRDLAYVAQRKSELVEALVAIAANKETKAKADGDFQKKQTAMVKQGKQDLSDSEKRAADAQAEVTKLNAAAAADTDSQLKQAELIKQGKQDLSDSEKRTADARAELIKLAAVREEQRGLVVTLSGSVLFQSGKSILMPSAQGKLDEVAHALLQVRERNLVIEGYTDSQGSEAYNQGLSQRRADAVRDYIVQRGYSSDRIQARGKGKGSPIADNASPEGRANNRRVEIVIER